MLHHPLLLPVALPIPPPLHRLFPSPTPLQAGAIVPLVELLGGSFGDAAQEEAAGALFALAGEEGNRVAITEAGGIGPLVKMLGSDNSTTQKHAKGTWPLLHGLSLLSVLLHFCIGWLLAPALAGNKPSPTGP